MARSDSGSVPRRAHHISSIAHLFLEEGRLDSAGDPRGGICQCAVAAPGGAAISAFASAGLAFGSPGSSILAEDDQVRWSAGTYFTDEAASSRVRPGVPDRQRKTWVVSAEARAHAFGSPMEESFAEPAREIHWNHLGRVGRVELAHLESMAAARSAGRLPMTPSGGLVWCLQEDEAGRFGPSYILGRLAEVIKPGRIEILLFPDAWSSAGRPGWLNEIRSVASLRYGPENLASLVGLAKKACDGIPLGIHQVAGPDNLAANFSGAGDSDSLWRRVAVAMSTGPAEC